MKTIDLRSDTVTLPSQEIRDAISNAKLGDDVFQEDPNVNLLESEAALIAGKEAALLVPSGTMGNLISFLVHCQREVIAISVINPIRLFMRQEAFQLWEVYTHTNSKILMKV